MASTKDVPSYQSTGLRPSQAQVAARRADHRRRRRVAQAIGSALRPHLEAMEPRTLLSAYTFSQIASFDANANGATPRSRFVLDPRGDLYGTTSTGGTNGYGTVFEVAKGSSAITVLASFNGVNGADPSAGVTFDPFGDLYGTTTGGGAYGDGAVFEIANGSKAITTLASFNGANGSAPRGPVAVDAGREVFGTTYAGGANNDGTVFEIPSSSSTLTTLASFNGTYGQGPIGGIVFDSSGNLYGTTSLGGWANDGTVFEMPRGLTTLATLATFYGSNGQYPECSLTMDSAGNLYGTTYQGGAGGDGTVFEIAAGTAAITSLASFNGANGSNPLGDVAPDASGNLFGTTSNGGDNGDGTTFELAKGSGSITTLVSFDGPNGSNPEAGVTLDSWGNLYGTTSAGGQTGAGLAFEMTSPPTVSFSLTYGLNPTNASEPLQFTVTVSGGVPDFENVLVEDTSNNNAVVATATLSGGSASPAIAGGTLAGGTHKLIAVYPGDAHYAASQSAALSETVYRPYFHGTIGYFGTNDGGTGPHSALVADANGNLYGTTSHGGAFGVGTVFEIERGSGAPTTLVSFNGADGEYPFAGLTIDPSGNLYGTTMWGGPLNEGVAFEIAAGSNRLTTLTQFNDAVGIDPQSPMVLDASGDLFGIDNGGPSVYSNIFEIAAGSNAVTLLAPIPAADSGANGLTIDASGNLYATTSMGGATNQGTVFEIARGSTAMTILASFDGTQGSSPSGGTTLDSSGDLFGTTNGGGAFGDGTVFELASGTNTITALTSFNAFLSPGNGLVLDPAGDLYGVTQRGGASNDGTAFEIANGSTALTTLAAFNGTNGQTPGGPLMLDSAGDLYGTTIAGGVNGNGAVFEIGAGTGAITTLASFGITTGQGPNGAVVFDASGNLFGTAQSGGAYGDGTVFEIAKGTTDLVTFATFNGNNGALPQGGVTLDRAGNLYGVTRNGGANNLGTVFEIATGTNSITTLISFNGTDGSFPDAGLTLDASGDIYGTTDSGSGGGTVFEIPVGSTTITTLASFNGANGNSPSAPLILDAAGNLYGTTYVGGASSDGTVFEVARGSAAVTTLATFNQTNGMYPRGAIVMDAAGNIYGTASSGGSQLDGTVFELPKGSGTIRTLATFAGPNGAHPDAGLTMDPAGNLYGTTSSGGPWYGTAGMAFEVARGSTTITPLFAFFGNDGTQPESTLALDAFGNLYGTTPAGGPDGYGTVFELAANTAVSLTPASGPNPAGAAQPLTFTTTVTGGAPDGEAVMLVDAANNNSVVARGTLSGGSATLTIPAGTLSVGTHNLVAAYAGDANFAASESAAYAQVVQAAPPTLVGVPVINGDNPHGLFNAPGQPTPGVQRSMVEDIVYTFSEPVTIPDANAAFTLALAGQMTGTLPATLFATAVSGSNGTQWAVSLTGQAVGAFGSIANGEYSITINPNAVFAAADGTTAMSAGETDTFYRLFGDLGGNRVVNAQDIGQMKTALSVYNPALDANWDGTDSALDVGRLKSSLSISYANDGFVTTI